jgi:hypothetical protein
MPTLMLLLIVVAGAAIGYVVARLEVARLLERRALDAKTAKQSYALAARSVDEEVAGKLELRASGGSSPALRWHEHEGSRLKCEGSQYALEDAAKELREPPRWWLGGGRRG